jgi:uncharacterized protein
MIHTKIKNDMIAAMKAKDSTRLLVMRGLMSSFTNEAIAKGRKPDVDLSDEEAIAVIKRAAKQRKDSIEQFQKGGRTDLAEKEEAELKIINEYLPEEMPRADIEKIVKMKIEELGATDKSSAGKLTGAVMREIAGRADGTVVREVIDGLLK